LLNILILRLSSLGDVTLLVPALQAIKKAYPESHLTCLVKKQYRAILDGSSLVDEVQVYEGFWPTLRALRGRQFDVLLDLHAVLRTRLLALFIHANLKHTYNKDTWKRYFMVFFHQRAKASTSKSIIQDRPQHMRHTSDRYLDALKVIGIGVDRVVVFQTAFLGDAVLTLPLMREIQKRLGPKKLCVLTRSEHAAIFEREGYETIKDDKRGGDSGFAGFWRVRNRLKTFNFDLAIIPHRSLRSAALAWCAGIIVKIGFGNSVGWWLFTRQVPFHWKEHDSERNLRLLDMLPNKPLLGSVESRIPISQEDRLAAKNIWSNIEVNLAEDFVIGIAPGSKWETKRWLAERFAALACALANSRANAKIVFLGGPEDRNLCADILNFCFSDSGFRIPDSRLLNLVGKLSLKELIAITGDLKLFISNDSGPMHIACGLGVPTVAIFGPTVRGFGFYPKGKATKVVEVDDLECRPCALHGGRACPRGHFLCMRLITVDQVLKACEEVLA